MAAAAAPADQTDELRVLVLPPTTTDGAAIEKLLRSNGIACQVFSSLTALGNAILEGAATVLIPEQALLAEPGDLLRRVHEQPVWSDLPIVLLSGHGREASALADIVSRLGNVSVVERPVRTSTLISLIRSNLRARSRQYQVREHLAQQEQAQRAIREAEQRYRLVIENITDYAIFMIDSQGRVASWNSGAEHMLGYSSAEVLGRSASMFFVSEEGPTEVLEREMCDARANGRAGSTGWRVRKDGQLLYVEGALTAVRDEQARLLGYAKFMRDITEKHRNEEERELLLQSKRAARGEAERSGRMKDEFLATLGHELRTPLNAILGWSLVLRRVPGVTNQITEALAVIERNARAQAQIIEDLLDMSSIISGKVRLEVQPLDLASIVDTAVSAIRPAAQAKGIQLDVAVNAPNRAVNGDPNRLQQVFWNLLTNAVKFTPREGHVRVALENAGSGLQVSVADSGEGIDASFLPHVFERFRQADPSTTRRYGGLGLGLSIVKQLVEIHGGRISAESAGAGMGSTFCVTLPLMPTSARPPRVETAPEHSEHAALPEIGEPAPHLDLCGVRALVVDDDPDARALVQRLLRECAATVTVAASAHDAFDALSSQSPDVLISDIGMPHEDGYSLIRRIRALDGEKSRIPAIALTAYAREEDRAKALQAGYQSHLTKPVEPATLVSVVASLTQRASPRS
ncbi:MAG: ATP-binding protein [Gammaproteobacteria bacterium]